MDAPLAYHFNLFFVPWNRCFVPSCIYLYRLCVLTWLHARRNDFWLCMVNAFYLRNNWCEHMLIIPLKLANRIRVQFVLLLFSKHFRSDDCPSPTLSSALDPIPSGGGGGGSILSIAVASVYFNVFGHGKHVISTVTQACNGYKSVTSVTIRWQPGTHFNPFKSRKPP